MSHINEEIDALVRDACSVVPVPKSEFRRRLINVIRKQNDFVIGELEGLPPNSGIYPDYMGTRNQLRAEQTMRSEQSLGGES